MKTENTAAGDSAPREETSSTEVPTRGISRQVSITNRLSRQNTFRLLAVEVSEEHGSSDEDEGEDGKPDNDDRDLLNGKILGNVQYLRNFFIDPNFRLGQERVEDMTEHEDCRSRTNSYGGPMKEIIIPDQEEAEYLRMMDPRRRRSSDITTETAFEELLAQCCALQNQPSNENQGATKVEPKTNSSSNAGDRNNYLGSLKGSFLHMCNVIHNNLKTEKVNASACRTSDSKSSFSVDAAVVPEKLSVMASELNEETEINVDTKDQNVDDDDSASLGTLETYFLQGGLFHDSAALAESKLARKQCSGGIYDSATTATTANSTVISDFLVMSGGGGGGGGGGDGNMSSSSLFSLSSFDSASFDSFVIGGCIQDSTNLKKSSSVKKYHRRVLSSNSLNDNASTDSQSLDLNDLYVARGLVIQDGGSK